MKSSQITSLFNKKQQEIKDKIMVFQNQESIITEKLHTLEPDELALNKIAIAQINLSIFSHQILLNDMSKELINIKNETILNDARKTIYKIFITLEEVVTPYVDVPYSEYEPNLKLITSYTDAERLKLMNKLGFSVNLLIDSLGDNSKWKWSYVEIRGRYAAILKNFIDLKKYVAEMDPRSPGYQERFLLVAKVKQLFMTTATSYREKYELTSQQLDDMQAAISYLNALKRIYNVLGEGDSCDDIKKKIEVWSAKMENDSRRKEKTDMHTQKMKSADKMKKKNIFGF